MTHLMICWSRHKANMAWSLYCFSWAVTGPACFSICVARWYNWTPPFTDSPSSDSGGKAVAVAPSIIRGGDGFRIVFSLTTTLSRISNLLLRRRTCRIELANMSSITPFTPPRSCTALVTGPMVGDVAALRQGVSVNCLGKSRCETSAS